jgi:hypothetical protein
LTGTEVFTQHLNSHVMLTGPVNGNDSFTLTDSGQLKITGALTGSEVFNLQGNANATINTAVNGTGSFTLAGSSSAEFGASDNENVTFAAGATGILKIDHSLTAPFSGSISGLTTSDKIDLVDLSYVSGKMTTNFSGTTSGGVLTVGNGTQSVQIKVAGDYTHSTWKLSKDATGGTYVVDPPATTQMVSSAGGSSPRSGTSPASVSGMPVESSPTSSNSGTSTGAIATSSTGTSIPKQQHFTSVNPNVTFTSEGGVTTLGFALSYDPAILRVTGVTPGPDLPATVKVTFTTAMTENGEQAHIAVTSEAPLPAGTIDLISLSIDSHRPLESLGGLIKLIVDDVNDRKFTVPEAVRLGIDKFTLELEDAPAAGLKALSQDFLAGSQDENGDHRIRLKILDSDTSASEDTDGHGLSAGDATPSSADPSTPIRIAISEVSENEDQHSFVPDSNLSPSWTIDRGGADSAAQVRIPLAGLAKGSFVAEKLTGRSADG